MFAKTINSLALLLFSLVSISQTIEPSLKYFNDYLRVKQIILLGEIHGTNEAPQLTLALTKAAIENDLPITLLLELPKVDQVATRSFVNSKGTEEDKLKILQLDFWKRQTQDGRTSRAMFDLLDSLRIQKTIQKKDVKVVLLDEPMSSDRDKSMFENIMDTWTTDSNRLFIGLMGNFHTRTTIGSGAVGELLKNSRAKTLALTVSHSNGEAWTCNSTGCGIKKMTSKGFEEKYRIYTFGQLKNWDGFVELGRLSASIPAISYASK